MNTISKGESITNKSFSIIRKRLGGFQASENVMEIVVRIAHTTGDVAFATRHHIPEEALLAGVEAAKNGAAVLPAPSRRGYS